MKYINPALSKLGVPYFASMKPTDVVLQRLGGFIECVLDVYCRGSPFFLHSQNGKSGQLWLKIKTDLSITFASTNIQQTKSKAWTLYNGNVAYYILCLV